MNFGDMWFSPVEPLKATVKAPVLFLEDAIEHDPKNVYITLAIMCSITGSFVIALGFVAQVT